MRLIAPLTADHADAASGSVEIYRTGTSTSAVCYSDAKGQTQTSTHALDAYGRVARYTNETVDCVLKNASGTEVLRFTDGESATAVEVRNLGFTGTSATGASGYGYATSLDRVLTSLCSSLGGHDGKVLVGDVEYNIKTYLLTTATTYNVKTYGAAGDGVTDDTAHVQQAISAACAAGGGEVFFPPGTYKITSALNVTSNNVTMRCGAPGTATIKRVGSGATDYWISCSSAVTTNLCLENLAFVPASTGYTAIIVAISAQVVDVLMRGCSFTMSQASLIDDSTGSGYFVTRLKLNGCHFSVGESSGTWLVNQPLAAIVNCTIAYTATCKAFGAAYSIVNCVASTSTNGIDFCWATGTVGNVVTGCSVTSGTGNIKIFDTLSGGVEAGNNGSFGAGINFSLSSTGASSYIASSSFDSRVKYQSNIAAGTTVTPDPGQFGIYELAGAAACDALTIGAPATTWPGARLAIAFKNTNAGAAITLTWNAAFVGGPATVAISSRSLIQFRYVPNDAKWYATTRDTGY